MSVTGTELAAANENTLPHVQIRTTCRWKEAHRPVITRRFYFLSADWGAAAGNRSSWGFDSQSVDW